MPDFLSRARRRVLATAAALVDAFGRPFKEADLRKGGEYAKPAGRGARPWTYAAIAGGLTPSKLAAMFTAADSGDNVELLTLATDIERRDSHAGAQLRTRKLALASLPWQVEAVSDDAREVALAEELQALVSRPEFTFLVIDLMDAVSKGYSVAEIAWERGAKWVPRKFTWRDQRHFALDSEDGTTLRLRTDEEPKNGVELPAFCFVSHVPRLASGPLATAGLVRPLAVMYSVKTLGVAAWLAYMEIFGIPTRIGKYTAAASDDDIDALEKAVALIGLDGSGVMPDTTQIELLEAIGRGNGTGEHERMAEWADRQVSKAILGQTMTADSGASLSQAKVHQLVRRDILLADALALAATLQRDLVEAYVKINYGPRDAYPRLRCVTDEPEDRKAFVDALGPMIDRGLLVEQSIVRDRLGIPEPAEGAAVLSPANKGDAPAQAPAADAQPQQNRLDVEGHRRRRRAELAELEVEARRRAAVQRLAEEGDGEGDFIEQESNPSADAERVLADAVRRAADRSETFAGFLAQLRAEVVDGDVMVKELAQRMLEARGVGDATDEVT